MTQKEELLKKFKEWYDRSYYFNISQEWVPPQPETIFEFIYSQNREESQLNAKISHLQAILEAAQDILKCVPLNWNDGSLGRNIYLPGFNEALEKYNQLKTKSQS